MGPEAFLCEVWSLEPETGRWGREGTEEATWISISSSCPTAELDQAYLPANKMAFKESCLEYLKQKKALPQ